MRGGPRACRALRLCLLLLLPLAALGEEATRAYRGLWGGLFRQQQAGSSGSDRLVTAPDRIRHALADLQALLHPQPPLQQQGGGGQAALDGAASGSGDGGGSGSPPGGGQTGMSGGSGGTAAGSSLRHLPALEDVMARVGNLATSLLDSAHSGGGGASSLLQRLARELNHTAPGASAASLDAAQLAATVASVQAWALAGLVARSGGAGGASASAGSLAGGSALSPGFKLVADPAWASFKPHTCVRLQNFRNAEGYNAALLGAAPCGRAAQPGTGGAAASGEALRWGSQASFLLDCSHGGSTADAPAAGPGSPGGPPSSSALSAALHAAASKAASAVEAALDRTTSCRLALASEGGGPAGGAALLHHSFERLLLGGTKLDALRIRVCNIAPSTLQFPAALAHGPAISLSSLKLNGRPLLRAPLHVSQAAAAADGCLAQLYRLPSRATKSSFVLSGWLQLGEGGGSGSGAAGGGSAAAGQGPGGGSSGGQFGVGEMASLEVTLGEYSALDAAAARLLGGITGGAQAAAAAQQQQQQQP